MTDLQGIVSLVSIYCFVLVFLHLVYGGEK